MLLDADIVEKYQVRMVTKSQPRSTTERGTTPFLIFQVFGTETRAANSLTGDIRTGGQ
jgi:hypothetical protein